MDFKLTNISGNVYYIPDATNVGVITEKTQNGLNFYLIDSNGSPDRGPLLLELLDSFAKEKFNCPWKLQAIITTHSHADHTSTCLFLQEKTGCKIWTTLEERGNLEMPSYEQHIICGGFPLPELQTPFYQSQSVRNVKIIQQGTSVLLLDGTKLTFIALPGHHFGMIGVLVKTTGKKEILFAADAIFGRERMKKYWIPFLLDVGSFKLSLRKIIELKPDFLLPSHGNLLQKEAIEATAELNRYAVLTTEKTICEILKTPKTAETLLQEIFYQEKIPCRLGQYVLIGCTIRSYLSYLYRSGRIRYFMQDNLMYWEKI